MTKQKVEKVSRARPRYFYGGIALVLLLVVAVFPLVTNRKAYAYGQITNRGITMTTSQVGVAADYTVSFKTATAGPIEGIVVDFCDDSPIINNDCQYNSGQSISVTGAALTGNVTGAGDPTKADWTVVGTNSSTGTSTNGGLITLENAASSSSVSIGTTIKFELTGIVNPDYIAATTVCPLVDQPNCTFYARMLTFASATGGNSAGGYTPTNVNTNVPTDAGGAALSTAAQISLTSKVQEELTFCVYDIVATGGGAGCGTALDPATNTNEVAPSVLLGNDNDVLSTAGPYVDLNTQFQVQTNASHSANINIVGNTLYTGLVPLPGLTTPTNPPVTPTPGVSMFGLCDYELAGGSGTITPSNGAGDDYSGGTGHLCSTATQTSGLPGGPGGASGGVTFFFDPNSADTTNNVTTGNYGDTIATVTPGATDTGVIAFMAEAGITQQAGIYTTSLGLIADASY